MTEANDPAPAAQQPDAVPPSADRRRGAGPGVRRPAGHDADRHDPQHRDLHLLTIVTLGFYTWYWYYKTHDEMKQHTGTGIGGPIALILAIFVGIAMPFVTPHEVGGLYERRDQAKPVSAMTGLWFILLGWLLFIGAIVWFVKTNRSAQRLLALGRRPGGLNRPAAGSGLTRRG